MHDGARDRLAEGSANADRRADSPKSKIETARALREIGNYEHRDNAKYSGANSVEHLDRDERNRIAGKRIEYGPNRQHSECDEQERLSAPRPRLPAGPGRDKRDRHLG